MFAEDYKRTVSSYFLLILLARKQPFLGDIQSVRTMSLLFNIFRTPNVSTVARLNYLGSFVQIKF